MYLEGATASETSITIEGKPLAVVQVGVAQPLNPGSYRVEAKRGVDAGEDAYSAGTISTVAMVLGGVGLAGGVALWVTAPRSRQEPSTALAVGPGSLQLRAASSSPPTATPSAASRSK